MIAAFLIVGQLCFLPGLRANVTFNLDLISSFRPISLSVTYPEIGTFERKGPMSHSGLLPDAPELIGTKFWYTSINVTELSYRFLPSLNCVFENSTIAVIVHGFGSSANDFLIEKIRNAILRYTFINGTILVNWELGAKLPNYFQAASNTQVVGRQLAVLLNHLKVRRKINPANMHLICFSLGSHVCGFAGKWTKDRYRFTVGRITALDPASFLFEYFDQHVSRNDASFVDVIHSSSGSNIMENQFGFRKPIGHVDFYPNGGTKQPQCENQDRMCNHLAALIFFEASMVYSKGCEYRSVNCMSYKKFIKRQCSMKNKSRMGFYSVAETGTGRQYLNTTKDYPHGCNTNLFY